MLARDSGEAPASDDADRQARDGDCREEPPHALDDAEPGAGAVWFASGADTATVFVGPVRRDAQGKLVVRLADGVRTPTGMLLGVLTVDLDWEAVGQQAFGQLEESMRKDGAATVRAFLVDTAGTVVGASRRAASATIAGCAALKAPVAGSMK